jgi:hypothetical protein
VSKRFVYGTERKLADLMSRDFGCAGCSDFDRRSALRRASGAGRGGGCMSAGKSTCWDCARGPSTTLGVVRNFVFEPVVDERSGCVKQLLITF